MSRELILVTKRKYEDLMKRVEECNERKEHDEVITRKEIVEDSSGEPTVKRSIFAQGYKLNLSTNN